MTTHLPAEPTLSVPGLILRPWTEADAGGLIEAYRDDALRRWASPAVDDEAGAARWIRERQRDWEDGSRLAFAVLEDLGPAGREQLVGQAVLKGVGPGTVSGEVGYWTTAHARGRGWRPGRCGR